MRRPNDRDVLPFAIPDRAGTQEAVDIEHGRLLRPQRENWDTGLDELDSMLGGGLHPGDLTVLAAYTGFGKSSFIDQLALRLSTCISTIYFSLEMNRARTTERLIAKIMRKPVPYVQALMSYENVPESLRAAVEKLQFDRNLRLVQTELDVPTTLASVMTQIDASGARLIILDDVTYLEEWAENAYGRVDSNKREIMRHLAQLAQERRVHVLSVHQLKAPTGPVNRRPSVGDISDSYHVAKIADTVLILHRPHIGDVARDSVVELLVRKNRNGPPCTLHVAWDGPTMSFRDMHPDEQARLTCCKH